MNTDLVFDITGSLQILDFSVFNQHFIRSNKGLEVKFVLRVVSLC